MRATLARAAGLTAVLLSALTLSASPAVAGGPTSAILSIPGAGSTASLYYTDPEYDELANLVGVAEPSGSFGGKESGSHEFGPGVTVTWLVHDVEPWRVDRIYLGGKDGPWISTQVSDFSGSSIWESPVLWHHPADGELSPTCSTAWAWAPRRRRTPPSTASPAHPFPPPRAAAPHPSLPQSGRRWPPPAGRPGTSVRAGRSAGWWPAP